MTSVLLQYANVLDVRAGTILGDHHVAVRDGRIIEVSSTPISGTFDRTVAVRGKTLMPGLVDGHVHVTAITADLAALRWMPPSYVAAKAAHLLAEMLMRGFTTVRDAAGADFGLARAVDEDVFIGPRILYCGHGLSQTGGHGDMRSPGEDAWPSPPRGAGLARICDGVADVRRAARDEIRKGAHQIKLLLSGGVASPTDRIDSLQFADEELRAAVEEAEAAGLYVMAHAYTARAVNRALRLGVHTIEHGNLIDDDSCHLFHETGAFLVPTLATYQALADEGISAGMPEASQRKVHEVLEAAAAALERAHRARVPMVYGSDLLGAMHRHQLNEFHLRKDVVPADELIRQATSNAATAFRCDGDFGVVEPGTRADLLVIDGNPLDDINVLTQPETRLLAIMKGGRFYRNRLG